MVCPSFCLACRYCPQNSFLIASKTVSADVLVFDYTKHDSQPTDNKCTPWIRCVGHEKEGYGLDWSPLEEGRLLSAADDHWVCEWDIRGNTKGEAKLNAKSKYTGHSNVVEVQLGAVRLQHTNKRSLFWCVCVGVGALGCGMAPSSQELVWLCRR